MERSVISYLVANCSDRSAFGGHSVVVCAQKVITSHTD